MVEYKNNNKKKISIINCKERKKVGHKKKKNKIKETNVIELKRGVLRRR